MILLVTCDVAWVGCFLRSSWLSWRFVPLSVNIPEEHLVSKWIRSFWGPIYGASDDFWACFFSQERGNLHISSYIPKSAISVYFNGTRKYIKIIKYIFSRFGAAPWEIFNCRWDQPQVEPRKDARGRQSTKAQRRGRWRGIREMTGATWGLIWMISTCFGNGLFLWFKMV